MTNAIGEIFDALQRRTHKLDLPNAEYDLLQNLLVESPLMV
jgi:hypothetical protein